MRRHQNGNALFLILIAVALFAALSYAITQSGRGGSNADKEKATVAASTITQYAASVRLAVDRMILGGAPYDHIIYTKLNSVSCTNNLSTCVFAPEGGNVPWQCPTPDQIADPNNPPGQYGWYFRSIAFDNDGFYIKDIGSNQDVVGRDAFAYLADIPLSVCQQINKGLGLNTTPADNSNFLRTAPDTTYNINSNVIYANPGQPFACVAGETNFANTYNYYHALVER